MKNSTSKFIITVNNMKYTVHAKDDINAIKKVRSLIVDGHKDEILKAIDALTRATRAENYQAVANFAYNIYKRLKELNLAN